MWDDSSENETRRHLGAAFPISDHRSFGATPDSCEAGAERHHAARRVTHVDYTARIQTVRRETNPLFWDILDAFRRSTGCPLIVNTSFNVRGEPIVCTPEDSYRCFMRTQMDYLVLENCVLDKRNQPQFVERQDWRGEFQLD